MRVDLGPESERALALAAATMAQLQACQGDGPIRVRVGWDPEWRLYAYTITFGVGAARRTTQHAISAELLRVSRLPMPQLAEHLLTRLAHGHAWGIGCASCDARVREAFAG